MTYYSLIRYLAGAGLFVDTADERVAIEEALEAYADDHKYAYVILKSASDNEGEPTHIVLDDVLYKLVEVDTDAGRAALDAGTGEGQG